LTGTTVLTASWHPPHGEPCERFYVRIVVIEVSRFAIANDSICSSKKEKEPAVKRLLLLTLALVLAVVVSAQPVSVDGRWEVNANVGGTASDLDCTFTQKDTDLTGSCATDQTPLPIMGKVDGKTVTWQFNTQYEGQTLTAIYSGTLESADKIVGTVDVQPIGVSGDFTAKRAK
jgi:hypothetical protein